MCSIQTLDQSKFTAPFFGRWSSSNIFSRVVYLSTTVFVIPFGWCSTRPSWWEKGFNSIFDTLYNHLGCKKTVNTGKFTQPQLMNPGFLNHQQYEYLYIDLCATQPCTIRPRAGIDINLLAPRSLSWKVADTKVGSSEKQTSTILVLPAWVAEIPWRKQNWINCLRFSSHQR